MRERMKSKTQVGTYYHARSKQPPLTANAEILLFDELTRSTKFKSSVELSINLGINHDKVMFINGFIRNKCR